MEININTRGYIEKMAKDLSGFDEATLLYHNAEFFLKFFSKIDQNYITIPVNRRHINDLDNFISHTDNPHFHTLMNLLKYSLFEKLIQQNIIPQFYVSEALIAEQGDWISERAINTFSVSFDSTMTTYVAEGLKTLVEKFAEILAISTYELNEINEYKRNADRLYKDYIEKKTFNTNGMSVQDLQFLKAAAICRIIIFEKEKAGKLSLIANEINKKIFDLAVKLHDHTFYWIKIPAFVRVIQELFSKGNDKAISSKKTTTLHDFLKDCCVQGSNVNINLYDRFQAIKKSAKEWLKDYTKNGFDHSERLENYLNDINKYLKEDQKLAPAEAFILLCAVYMHDIGYMNKGNLDATGHPERSRDLIIANPNKYLIGDFLPFNNGPARVVLAISQICYGHSEESHCPLQKLDSVFPDQALSKQPLNLKKLAALLRLVDETDDPYIRPKSQLTPSLREKTPLVEIESGKIVWYWEASGTKTPNEFLKHLTEKRIALHTSIIYLSEIGMGFWDLVLRPPVDLDSYDEHVKTGKTKKHLQNIDNTIRKIDINDLYEKRKPIYDQVMNILSIIIRDLNITTDELIKFRRATADADFLFGPDEEIPEYINMIFQHGVNLGRWKQEYIEKPSGYDHKRTCDELAKETSWFLDSQLTHAKEIFKNYLTPPLIASEFYINGRMGRCWLG